jgi:alkanesulfonate monooxygenase SsuD/methylene tetrahydromethanopterin reductase-like flavin-dependent oxidoreductase (luciferase family)
LKIDPDMPDSDITAEYMIDNVFVVGSLDEVADKLRQIYHDVGGYGVVVIIRHEWEPRDRWLDSMTLLAEEVMPKLADLD